MASVTYHGTFGGEAGADGLTTTSLSHTGTPLQPNSVITGVTYTLKISARNYTSSEIWNLWSFAVGGQGGSPNATADATMYGTEHTFSGSMAYSASDVSRFTAEEITVYALAYSTYDRSYLWDWSVTVYYETPTPCKAPTTVETNATNAAPGAKVTLSWSGATAGDSNPITGYEIYRLTSPDGEYSKLTTIGSNATSGSATVTAPTTNGVTYCYKVRTVGTRSGYSSGLSTAYAELTCSFASVGAPTSLRIDLTNAAPGAEATLSWSGATAGDNNAIAGYDVYRATSVDGEYSLLTSVASTAAADSVAVTAPTANGTTYYYKVQTKGTLADSDSALSSAYTSLACTYSAPNAPRTVAIGGQGSLYVKPGTMATLTWSGASGGANNPITGYDVYRDGVLYLSSLPVDTTSQTVTAHDTAGRSYRFSVVTKGAYSDSAPSAACVLYAYTDPVAPTELDVSTEVPVAGARVLLSWSGAASGSFNDIVGYRVYRSTTAGGALAQVASVDSRDPAASCYVAAPGTPGEYYYFRVETVGSYSASGASEAHIAVGARELIPGEDDAVEVIVPAPRKRKKRGFILGDYDTAAKGWTLTGWSFPEPPVQTNYVDVPGRADGPLDRSTALTGGDPRHGSRQLTLTLECSEGTRLERDAIISEMVNRLHGQRRDIVFPDDPTRYATGRLDVKRNYSDLAHASVTVSAVCSPWMYSKEEVRVSLAVISDAGTAILSNGGRRLVVPEVTVTGYGAQVHLTCDGHEWTLGVGTYRLPELVLPMFSDTVITYSGIGTLSFVYREAIL